MLLIMPCKGLFYALSITAHGTKKTVCNSATVTLKFNNYEENRKIYIIK